MLAIILFHVRLPRADLFYGLCRMGNVGVDMFLFLSGIGLWFSWCKLPSFRSFYLHRCRRIYPAWLIMSGLFYIPRFLHGSHSFNEWLNLLGNLLCGSGFWLYGDLTFWYVPAIMLLYVFAPFYMQLLKRSRRFCLSSVVGCVLVLCCSVLSSRSQSSRLSGNFLEPHSHLPNRNKFWGNCQKEGGPARAEGPKPVACLYSYIGALCLFGANKTWLFPFVL